MLVAAEETAIAARKRRPRSMN
ncbi:hypothetical protein [Paraburkholderia sp. A2RI-6]